MKNHKSFERHIPGEFGLWVFLLSDLLLFGLYFSSYSYDFSQQPQLFLHGRTTLHGAIGFLNTLLLLTGSWAVALAVRYSQTDVRRTARLFAGAAWTGAIFLGLKGIEYYSLISQGSNVLTNQFYSWYFILTSLHAIHVFGGVIVLLMAARSSKTGTNILSIGYAESIGCYWHMVDLLWIAIFMLLYAI